MIERGASFSEDRRYRYSLTRFWDRAKGYALFICLNPSIADEQVDDPTANRCMHFAAKWGYGGLKLVNLFALRSTDPTAIRLSGHGEDPVGNPQNDAYINLAANHAKIIVAAWGNGGTWSDRGREVVKMLRRRWQLHCLGITKQGQPSHPLFLPGDRLPVILDMEQGRKR